MNITKCLLLIAAICVSNFLSAQICPVSIENADTTIQLSQLPANTKVTLTTDAFDNFRLDNNGLDETVQITLCGERGAAIAVYHIENEVNVGYSVPVSNTCSVLDLRVKSLTKSYFIGLTDNSCKPIGSATLELERQVKPTAVSGSVRNYTGAVTESWIFEDLEYNILEPGVFEFPNLEPGQKLTLKPKRVHPNSIYYNLSVLDILKILRHILGKETLTSAFEVIAADVDQNDAITVTDINLIRHVMLRRFDSFKEGTSHYSYFLRDTALEKASASDILVFGKEALEIIGGEADSVKANFVEIKLGHVTAWEESPLVESRSVKTVSARQEGKNLSFTIPVEEQQAGELVFAYDPTTIQFDPANSEIYGQYHLYEKEGLYYFHWTWLADIDKSKNTKLHFDYLNTSQKMPEIKRFYTINKAGSLVNHVLEKQASTIKEWNISSVYPNPGYGEAHIDLESPVNTLANILLFAADGSLIGEQTTEIRTGFQTLTFNRQGAAFVQIKTQPFSKTLQLIQR